MMPSEEYFPLSESAGGWRFLTGDEELMRHTGTSGDLLRAAAHGQQRTHAGFLWSIVVVRHGHVILELRDLAPFGYLMLHRGLWRGRRIVPESWVDESTSPSQPHNPEYGLGWWVNREGTTWPYSPADTFALAGMLSNRCYVLPSHELVIARVGNGPQSWNDRECSKVCLERLNRISGSKTTVTSRPLPNTTQAQLTRLSTLTQESRKGGTRCQRQLFPERNTTVVLID